MATYRHDALAGTATSSRSATPAGHRRSALIEANFSNPSRSMSFDTEPRSRQNEAVAGLQSNQLHLVLSEIAAVTLAVRKATRWNAATSTSLARLTSFSYSAAQLPSTATKQHNQLATRDVIDSASTPAVSADDKRAATGSSARIALRGMQRGAATDIGSSSTATARRLGLSLGADGKSDDPISILTAFATLKAQLRTCTAFSAFPLPALLAPFLRVILSPRTSAPVTSAALQAVHKFLVYNVVSLSAPGAQIAVAEIAHATSHCRFEASEATTDELVLVRILSVMRELICEPAEPESAVFTPDHVDTSQNRRIRTLADCLGDDSVCEMMETGLSMCCQTRLSEVLRRTAELSMTAMVRTLFSRLPLLPPSADEFFASGADGTEPEPEHATLAADPIGEDAELDEKKRRRMTMPDPTSNAFPAAAAQVLDQLREMGEEEDNQAAAASQQAGHATDADAQQATEEAPVMSEDFEQSETGQSETMPVKVDDDAVEASLPADTPAEPATTPMHVDAFGLPAILEVCRVIVSLLDPNNLQHTHTMRRLGMSMLISVLETSGRSIGDFPSLRALMQDTACKHLFTIARSHDTIPLSLSLRALSTMFETMREHLKLQHELFLNYLMDRLSPTFPLPLEPWNERTFDSVVKRAADFTSRTGAPDHTSAALQVQPPPPPAPPAPPLPKGSERAPATGEARELYLEAFALLFRNFDSERSAEYLVDLYLNYDCYTDCDNMYERVLHFLCRAIHAANPQNPSQQDAVQLFALDALLSFIAAIADRAEASRDSAIESDAMLPNDLSVESLALQKAKKATILDGASRFNAKPKDGLIFLEKEGLLDYGDATLSREDRIARFLKECPRLDKKLVGDYIGRPDNVKVLEAFIRLFDFKDKPIAEALREMLESFRLPGESQQIERITQTFASTYFAAEPDGIATEDAVFILAYSVIMLNTDQHNPQNKRRMTVEDYRKNLRGVNGGDDFGPELTGAIYESIRKREIVMPEEHAGQLGFEYTWKELLRRSRTAGSLVACNTTAFDRSMFEASWKPILSSIAFAFSTFSDEYMVERAISGIRQCGILASDFDLIEVFDFMVHTLATATGLLDSSVPQTLTSNPTVEVESQLVTVSPLSTRFGINFKGQLAAVVLFTIANGNVDAIRTGWSDLFEIFKNLFAHGMLPSTMVQMEDLADGLVPIPLKPKKIPGPSPQDPRAQGGGLFSTLSSYLLSPYSNTNEPAPYEATSEDIEATLSSVDCIASCRLEDLWHQVLHLGTDSHLCAVHYLRFLIEALTVEKVLYRESSGWTDGTSTPTSVHQGANAAANGKDSGKLQPASSSSNLAAGGAGSHSSPAGGQALNYDPRVPFLLELLTQIVTSSPSQLVVETWPWLSEHITSVLRNAKSYHPMTVEREAAALLRVIASAAGEDSLRDQIFVALDLLRELPVDIRISGSKQLLAGLTRILSAHPTFVRSHTEWSLVFALISDNSNMRNADSARLAFETTRTIVVGNPAQTDQGGAAHRLSPDNFLPAVKQLIDFANGADTSAWRNMMLRETPQRRTTITEKKEMADAEKVQQERGVEAIEVLESLKSEIPRLIDIELGAVNKELEDRAKVDEVWSKYWLAMLTGLVRQWTNAHAPARSAAVTLLQRTLFSPQLVPSGSSVSPSRAALIRVVFSATLFPLIEDLLKPQVYQIDPPSAANKNGGMLEIRIRASALICKTFLHLLPHLTPSSAAADAGAEANGNHGDEQEFAKLWLDVLDLMDRMINSTGGNAGRRNPLTEAIPENLKNVLLVMSTSQLLSPEGGAGMQKRLFDMTHDRLQRFLPGLVEEVFRPPAAAPASVKEAKETEPVAATEGEESQQA